MEGYVYIAIRHREVIGSRCKQDRIEEQCLVHVPITMQCHTKLYATDSIEAGVELYISMCNLTIRKYLVSNAVGFVTY